MASALSNLLVLLHNRALIVGHRGVPESLRPVPSRPICGIVSPSGKLQGEQNEVDRA